MGKQYRKNLNAKKNRHPEPKTKRIHILFIYFAPNHSHNFRNADNLRNFNLCNLVWREGVFYR